MEKTIAQITEIYFKELKTEAPGIAWRKKIYNEIQDLVDSGYPKELIIEAIRKDALQFITTTKLIAKDNLIREDLFYYHPHLQLSPPAPVIQLNEDGTFTEIEEEFYLRLKKYFTMDDVIDYFYLKFPEALRSSRNKDIGAMNYIYNQIAGLAVENDGYERLNTLDLVLYLIDTAQSYSFDMDKKVKGIFDLKEYIDESLYNYKEKIHYASINGIDKQF